MPGPFPGMDPYLEQPALWAGVHQALISSTRALLNAALPPQFVADAGERLYLVERDRNLYPDVLVIQRAKPGGGSTAGSATATLPIDDRWTITAPVEEIREPFIKIVTTTKPERVVTVIEVLSPGNKAAGTRLRTLYLAKQEELFLSETSLVEIDLLRAGQHTVLAPVDSLRARGAWDYLCCLHRGKDSWKFEVWHTGVRERLPRIAIPLDPELPDLPLDLQQVFDRAYDEGGYARRIDYAEGPQPPLSPEDAQWADGLLRAAGLR